MVFVLVSRSRRVVPDELAPRATSARENLSILLSDSLSKILLF